MKTIPYLKEADIRPLAIDRSFARSEDYHYSNAMENVVWRDGLPTAEVERKEDYRSR
jgi:cytochrome c2